ncbi:hypothetical protein F5883DRAFT_127928 [Diaporthe sp. PMI_573]|nr:hypothetical protein F5883DRAFT_127928 [Diaporthaceae sp. PMI_573]
MITLDLGPTISDGVLQNPVSATASVDSAAQRYAHPRRQCQTALAAHTHKHWRSDDQSPEDGAVPQSGIVMPAPDRWPFLCPAQSWSHSPDKPARHRGSVLENTGTVLELAGHGDALLFFAAAQYAPVSTKLLRRGIRSLAPNRSKWRLQMVRERDNCPASRRGSKDPTWQRHVVNSTNQLQPKALVLHGTHVSLRNIARVHWRCWTASGRSMFALLGTDHPGSYRAGCTL